MGYYPTPVPVVERIRSFLKFPNENANVLDPCCGEGQALKELVEGENATTYGIEPDECRSRQAKDNLNHVLPCGYEDARISNNAFGGLFLNPPYDWESPSSDDYGSERKEKTFLKGTIRYLPQDGVLVYIVPQKRVGEDVAKILSYRFDDFNTYRFPDGEFERFGQIVLFGRKKPKHHLDNGTFEKLAVLPYETLDEIPLLESPVYDIPASPEVKLFRSTLIDEEELEKELQSSSLWSKLREYDHNNGNGIGRPPLPLHTGHLGLLLAGGYLDGVVGEGEDRHIVRGKVEKHTHTDQEYQGNVLVEKQTDSYRVSVKILKRNGEITTLM